MSGQGCGYFCTCEIRLAFLHVYLCLERRQFYLFIIVCLLFLPKLRRIEVHVLRPQIEMGKYPHKQEIFQTSFEFSWQIKQTLKNNLEKMPRLNNHYYTCFAINYVWFKVVLVNFLKKVKSLFPYLFMFLFLTLF